MADLSVTLTESLLIDGKQQGGTKTTNIGACTEIYKRTVTCTTNQQTKIVEFRTGVHTAPSAVDLEGTKYIRVTNLDSTNPVTLSLQIAKDEDASADESTSIALGAGQHFLMGIAHDGIATDDTNATYISALNDLESIIINPAGNTVLCEVFVAGVIA